LSFVPHVLVSKAAACMCLRIEDA